MDKEKYVDESWKDSVAQGKDSAAPDAAAGAEAADEMEINFVNYLTSLVLQSLIFLGELPHPLAQDKVEVNLKQAKLLIDTLLMLREKTKGNLTKEEEEFFNMSLYELQMKYVERAKADLSKLTSGGEGVKT